MAKITGRIKNYSGLFFGTPSWIKERVDLHTQAFHFFDKNYYFAVRFDICDLVIICSEVHVHDTEI